MAIVDDRGRLFGRLNLLDAVVLVLLVGLIPLGYAAYALFREQPPRLISISPARSQQMNHLPVTVRGENLRPYMRVSAGTHQAIDFQFRSTSEVEVPFGSLPPGEYDIILYDQAQERARLPKALVIEASALPPTEIVSVGAFGNLDAAGAAKITAGLRLDDVAEVLTVGKPVPDLTTVFSAANLVGVPIPNALRLPAVVKFHCNVRTQQGRPHCTVDDATVAPTALLMLPTPLGKTPFQIEQLRSPHPVQDVPIEVRFTGDPNVVALIKPGDVDRRGTTNELAAGSRVTGVSAPRRVADNRSEIDVRLTAQLQNVDGQWLYDTNPLRAGSTFMLRTSRYELTGVVTRLPAAGAAAGTQ
jgi:hypothetical protein